MSLAYTSPLAALVIAMTACVAHTPAAEPSAQKAQVTGIPAASANSEGPGAGDGGSSDSGSSSAMKCAPAGPILLRLEQSGFVDRSRSRTATLYKSGSYQLAYNDILAEEGCLPSEERDRVEDIIAAADLTPPPPLQKKCMARPTSYTLLSLPPRATSASHSEPCGTTAAADVYEIEKVVGELVPSQRTFFSAPWYQNSPAPEGFE